MNAFKQTIAIRIAAVSLALASLASPAAWFFARESAEQNVVSFAIEESNRLFRYHGALDLTGPDAADHAALAAKAIVGGLFDIAEIYDRHGRKLAEALTDKGAAIEDVLPRHDLPADRHASYENLTLSDGRWLLRVFVPLRVPEPEAGVAIAGYLEGVRIVPDWQRSQILATSLNVALMVGLASLLCGAILYPVIVHLAAENEHKSREILNSHISMMDALGRAIAKRDSDTGAHNYRVAWIASRVAERMGMACDDMQALIIGSFLHDVGKIGIPDAILLKPGKLDAAEMAVMRTHVAHGEEIVTGMGWLGGAHAVVAAHHEKWNGLGYPRQLAGEAIPLAARIFAVADVFDALCSKRPYKEPLGFDATMEHLERDSGQHFDPAVMAVFRVMARDIFDRLSDTDETAVRSLLEQRIRHYF